MSPFSSRHGHPRGGRHGRGFADMPSGRPPGARRGRMFDQTQFRLLVLHVLDQQPCHGYELIRTIGELAGGDYSPSPGAIYPTLSLLEELGLATADPMQDGRRQFHISAAGKAHLQQHQAELQVLLQRLSEHGCHARARRSPEIQRAMENLKTALRLRYADSAPDAAAMQRIAEALDRAASEIAQA
ncbi:PadR family transcriptional regulator [Pseudoxanthomonas kalamensis]|uniref:PadR family transcriptional regulator n=1 Tax=Pseudoxanthomonas kalamensis TaxID=289483 RepID=UPI001B85BD07|nr:PadR family transcriptional regulator [Pseudoxanthomonas kalamensis]